MVNITGFRVTETESFELFFPDSFMYEMSTRGCQNAQVPFNLVHCKVELCVTPIFIEIRIIVQSALNQFFLHDPS